MPNLKVIFHDLSEGFKNHKSGGNSKKKHHKKKPHKGAFH
ncbi:hypothetical protein B4129_1700 [Bacillus safensis]|nr:hypothetical protein B4129_1700 [Bacillus safensis]